MDSASTTTRRAFKNAESERAKAEASLLAARRLEEWNRMSAVVTHEINNPLAAIQNLLFLMQVTPGITPELARTGATVL